MSDSKLEVGGSIDFERLRDEEIPSIVNNLTINGIYITRLDGELQDAISRINELEARVSELEPA